MEDLPIEERESAARKLIAEAELELEELDGEIQHLYRSMSVLTGDIVAVKRERGPWERQLLDAKRILDEIEELKARQLSLFDTG